MKKYIDAFKSYLNEAEDPTYYQDTFYFTLLISLSKEIGGSRDETKNDIRAVAEVLTVTLVEPEKGGIQRDIGGKYLSTLKLHVRKPKNVNKTSLMNALVQRVNNLRGITVLRYKEHKPKTRRKQFYGSYKIDEGEYYQSSAHMRDVAAAAHTLTSGGPQKKGGAPYNRPGKKKQWKSSPPGALGGGSSASPGAGLEETAELEGTVEEASPADDRLKERVEIVIRPPADDFAAFGTHEELNQKLWESEARIRPGVRGALMDIAEEFIEGLDLDAEVKDVTLTGSTANYNWSRFSDIDMHIIVDFADINENEELVKKFFDAVRSNWNKLHDIRVKGHEVEIYIQNDDESHVSTGVYSLLHDEWLTRPKLDNPDIDQRSARKKMLSLKREVDKLGLLYDNKKYKEAFDLATRLKEKLKSMRQSGLERDGLYSPENLAFKMLRRSGDIEKLFTVYTGAYDILKGLDENFRLDR